MTFIAAANQKRGLLDDAATAFDEASAAVQEVIKATSGAVAAAQRSVKGEEEKKTGEDAAPAAAPVAAVAVTAPTQVNSLVNGLQDLVARAWLLRARCEADKGVRQ